MDWRYDQVAETLRQKDIDLSRYEILIDGSSLNGELICGASISQCGNWVCLPVHDEDAEIMTGEYCYRPQCFEVMSHFRMWVSNDSMAYQVDVRLLRSLTL